MTSRRDYPVIPILESKSAFFCTAKWKELYLYLNHGQSNSCHHPIPHNIPSELLSDPYVLHNTPHKMKMQQLMMDGYKPSECHMCWHIEDLDPDVVSDRIIKSQASQDDIKTLKVDPHYVPELIEVVFDNYCNLSCSYCDSGQSSTWAAKIHRQPLMLQSDYRKLYSTIYIEPGTTKPEFLDAWNRWWPEIASQVKVLKISGGEPLMSKHAWQFFDTLGTESQCKLYINSNFTADEKTLDRFIKVADQFKQTVVHASLDATGDIAEYARQGLDYNTFLRNVHTWCQTSNTNNLLSFQSTVSIFNIWGLTDMFDLSIELSQKYPGRIQSFYSTLVRFPEFQSVVLLPTEIKQRLSTNMTNWLHKNSKWLTQQEQSYVNKIIVYLKEDPKRLIELDPTDLAVDFKKFLLYYDTASKKTYQEVYPIEFIQWINSI